MTLDGIVIGLFALAVGAAFCFWGFRFFLILLPIWGFFAGFLFGANVTTSLFGDGFLATVTGWAIGFVVGIVFAILSYLYYWIAVVLLGASIGYAAGLGLASWLGFTGQWGPILIGIGGAIILAALVVILRVPKYLVIVLSALGGGFAIVAGVGLAIGRIPVSAMNAGVVGSYVMDELSWICPVAAIILAVIGGYYQIRSTDAIEMLVTEGYRNPGMPSQPTSPY
jgi:hypothetical protein